MPVRHNRFHNARKERAPTGGLHEIAEIPHGSGGDRRRSRRQRFGPGQGHHRRLGAGGRPWLDRRRQLLRPAGDRTAEDHLPQCRLRLHFGAGRAQADRRHRGHGLHPRHRRPGDPARRSGRHDLGHQAGQGRRQVRHRRRSPAVDQRRREPLCRRRQSGARRQLGRLLQRSAARGREHRDPPRPADSDRPAALRCVRCRHRRHQHQGAGQPVRQLEPR